MLFWQTLFSEKFFCHTFHVNKTTNQQPLFSCSCFDRHAFNTFVCWCLSYNNWNVTKYFEKIFQIQKGNFNILLYRLNISHLSSLSCICMKQDSFCLFFLWKKMVLDDLKQFGNADLVVFACKLLSINFCGISLQRYFWFMQIKHWLALSRRQFLLKRCLTRSTLHGLAVYFTKTFNNLCFLKKNIYCNRMCFSVRHQYTNKNSWARLKQAVCSYVTPSTGGGCACQLFLVNCCLRRYLSCILQRGDAG